MINNNNVRNFRIVLIVTIAISWGIVFSSAASAEETSLPDIMSAEESIKIEDNHLKPIQTCEIGGEDVTSKEAQVEAKRLVECVRVMSVFEDVELPVERIKLLQKYRQLSWRSIGTTPKELEKLKKQGFISTGYEYLERAKRAHGEIVTNNELLLAEQWFMKAGKLSKELATQLHQKVAQVKSSRQTSNQVALDW